MTSAVQWYGMCLAMPSEEPFRLRLLPQPVYSADHPLPLLLAMLERQAAVLSILVAASDPSARGFHAFGRPDPIGYAAMGCTEILSAHRRHRAELRARAPPARRPLPSRGIAALPLGARRRRPLVHAAVGYRPREPRQGRPDTPPNWAWHASPTAEWDGEVKPGELRRRVMASLAGRSPASQHR